MINPLEIIIKSAHAVDDPIGTLTLPSGLPQDITKTGDFISGIVRFIFIIAGLFTLWQFLTGGLGMITGGADKGKLTEAQHKIQMAITGLAIMAGSFIIIALASQLLFGNFMAILAPELQSVQ